MEGDWNSLLHTCFEELCHFWMWVCILGIREDIEGHQQNTCHSIFELLWSRSLVMFLRAIWVFGSFSHCPYPECTFLTCPLSFTFNSTWRSTSLSPSFCKDICLCKFHLRWLSLKPTLLETFALSCRLNNSAKLRSLYKKKKKKKATYINSQSRFKKWAFYYSLGGLHKCWIVGWGSP